MTAMARVAARRDGTACRPRPIGVRLARCQRLRWRADARPHMRHFADTLRQQLPRSAASCSWRRREIDQVQALGDAHTASRNSAIGLEVALGALAIGCRPSGRARSCRPATSCPPRLSSRRPPHAAPHQCGGLVASMAGADCSSSARNRSVSVSTFFCSRSITFHCSAIWPESSSMVFSCSARADFERRRAVGRGDHGERFLWTTAACPALALEIDNHACFCRE